MWDDMTGNSVKRTPWETLSMDMAHTYYYQFSKINDSYLLSIKVLTGDVCSVIENDKLIIKLEDGELINLHARESVVSCRGCGAIGISGSDMQE
jgi:hypothetical protein